MSFIALIVSYVVICEFMAKPSLFYNVEAHLLSKHLFSPARYGAPILLLTGPLGRSDSRKQCGGYRSPLPTVPDAKATSTSKFGSNILKFNYQLIFGILFTQQDRKNWVYLFYFPSVHEQTLEILLYYSKTR